MIETAKTATLDITQDPTLLHRAADVYNKVARQLRASTYALRKGMATLPEGVEEKHYRAFDFIRLCYQQSLDLERENLRELETLLEQLKPTKDQPPFLHEAFPAWQEKRNQLTLLIQHLFGLEHAINQLKKNLEETPFWASIQTKKTQLGKTQQEVQQKIDDSDAEGKIQPVAKDRLVIPRQAQLPSWLQKNLPKPISPPKPAKRTPPPPPPKLVKAPKPLPAIPQEPTGPPLPKKPVKFRKPPPPPTEP